MDILDALKSRRSIRTYSDAPVSRETLLGLVDAARLAPSGANKNSWRFVLVTDKGALKRLGEAHRNCQWLASAQAAIAIAVDPASTRYWLEDCCAAATYLWLAATGRGLGVAWAAMYQSDNVEESQRRQALVREALSIPANLSVPIVLGLGHPQGAPSPRKVPPLEEITCWESYTLKGA